MNRTAFAARGFIHALAVTAGLGLMAACQSSGNERVACQDRGLDTSSKEYRRCVKGAEQRAMDRELQGHYQGRGP